MSKQDELMERRRAQTRYSLAAQPMETGVGIDTQAIEAEALAYCQERGHRIRGGRGNPQGCRPDLQDALMGRLGQRTELPPLPSRGVDAICRLLDGILGDFGEHSLDTLLEHVNVQREAESKDPYTLTALSIRLRELREHGRTLNHRAMESGSDTYWYERPKAEDSPGVASG